MCRYRLYAEFQENNDPKWRKVAQELGIAEDFKFPARGSIDAEPGVVEELLGNPERDIDIRQPPTPPLGEPSVLIPLAPPAGRAPDPIPCARGPAATSSSSHLPDPVASEPRPRSPRVSGGDTSIPMDVSEEALMNGEQPFDLDMDLGGEGEDESMVSALIMAGANFDQARTYAAAVRGKIDPPTFMEEGGQSLRRRIALAAV